MRLFSKIFGGGLVLALVLASIALVPPHLQVRSVEPGLPDATRLRALLSVEDGPVRLRYVNTSSQALPQGELGHPVFLAEWANGNLFMIDAGMDRKTAVEFGKLMELALDADEAVSHGTIAELLGDDTMRVMGVAYTHLHLDHTQGTVPFCAARGSGAVVFQTHWQADLHNFNTVEGATIVADSCLERGTLSDGTVQSVRDSLDWDSWRSAATPPVQHFSRLRSGIDSGFSRATSRTPKRTCRAIPGRGFSTAISSCRNTRGAATCCVRGLANWMRTRT